MKTALTHGVDDAVKEILVAANVLDFTPNGKIILAEGDQLDLDGVLEKPDPAANGFWWRIVIMPVVNGIQPPPQYSDEIRPYKFYIRIDANFPPEDNDYADSFLSNAHRIVYAALDGATTTIEDASQLYQFKRERYPTQTFSDQAQGFRYKSASYFTIIEPKQ